MLNRLNKTLINFVIFFAMINVAIADSIATHISRMSSQAYPPIITVTSPDITRSLNITAKTTGMTVIGKAESSNGVVQVTVNGKQVAVDKQGNFSVKVFLKVGENEFIVTAVDVNENKTTKSFTINRTTGPK